MDVCALCAMQLFLNDRLLFESDPEKPLFLYKNGIVLSHKLFVDSTRLYKIPSKWTCFVESFFNHADFSDYTMMDL